MDKLHTPPGYIEYPRDPKHRPDTPAGRLSRMASAYGTLDWWWFCLGIVLWDTSGALIRFIWLDAVFATVFFIFIALGFRRGIAEIFLAKGLPKSYSLASAAILGVLADLYSIGIPGHFVFGVLFFCCWAGSFGWARAIVYSEFRKYDPNFPRFFSAKSLWPIAAQAMVTEKLKARGIEAPKAR